MRQLAGHHSCPRLEHKKKKSSGLRLNLEAAEDLQRAPLAVKAHPPAATDWSSNPMSSTEWTTPVERSDFAFDRSMSELRLPYFRRGIFPPPRRLLVWHVKPAQWGPFHLSFSPEVRCIASKPIRGTFNIFDSGSCSGASARGSFCVDSGKRRARFVAPSRAVLFDEA
jgi:hypothetical protein